MRLGAVDPRRPAKGYRSGRGVQAGPHHVRGRVPRAATHNEPGGDDRDHYNDQADPCEYGTDNDARGRGPILVARAFGLIAGIIWAFHEYATGEYSVAQLAAALEEQGLVTRPSRTYRSRPLSTSALGVILGDPYYTGVIRYKGKLYPGRHQPLISKELYLEVKAILASRNRTGDRDRVHFHYLKGMIYCTRCHAQGRESRLVYSQSTGNGGTYEYFTCSAKLKGQCDMQGIRAEELEDAVATQVALEGVPPTTLDWINAGISAAMDDLQTIDRQAKEALTRQLTKLTQQEARLVDALADGDLPVPRLREKLQQLMLQKGVVEERLIRSDQSLRVGAERVRAAIDLLRDPGAIYRGLPDPARRELLHALFSRMYAEITETDVSLQGERTAGNEAIQRLARHASEPGALSEPSIKKIPGVSAEDFDKGDHGRYFQVNGSNKTNLVAGAGLEPATSRL
ncbi:hypothetical protein GCM10027058_08570 [Microbacterium neimengense]